MRSSTSGQGDPYWYEWTVGLVKVVEMLQPESEIVSVSFQVTGAKGWDDVAVQHANGNRTFFQVKHSRVDKNLTFGDLVTSDEDGTSLINSLFAAWREMTLDPGRNKCVLFTNRTAGASHGRSSAGVARPPLTAFISWLKDEIDTAGSISDCCPRNAWEDAWNEWLAQLTNGTDSQKLAFLKALDVQTSQPELVALEEDILDKLASTFQIPHERAKPLFHSLDHALREWTTGKKRVTAEDAFTAMALADDWEVEHRAPPPPAPFFPSRLETSAVLEGVLADQTESPILFLCADPGAGKTSLISDLTNRRHHERLRGLVGIRYFAYRPITPESPLIPPDADNFVRPERLWFSLLSQLRQGLKGKLKAYQVPLRNNLINWTEARANVLRIAGKLGSEMDRPFVIVIDGIDHAARAMRYDNSEARQFFSSLPSPAEIADYPIRFLIAGQPPQAYPEYPDWLRAPHPKVKVLPLGRLTTADILLLLRETESPLAAVQAPTAVAMIEAATNGNTLAVVFAVKEAAQSINLVDLEKRLRERNLQDGLQEYYKAIWNHTLASLVTSPHGTENALASALCLTLERLTGALMASAFHQLGLSAVQWDMLLGSLGPLVISDDNNGFRVLHNDVRVYLSARIASMPLMIRRAGASMLADYYLKPESERYFAHKSLRRLLNESGRAVEWAHAFNVDWVFEAAALGIDCGDTEEECVEALSQGVKLKDWDTMIKLVCAIETRERWQDAQDLGKLPKPQVSTYQFIHSEVFIPPLAEWKVDDLRQVSEDAESLLENSELFRARSLLERWFKDLSVQDLVMHVKGLVDVQRQADEQDHDLTAEGRNAFEQLGAVCRSVEMGLGKLEPQTNREYQAVSAFAKGWIRRSCSLGPFDSPSACFGTNVYLYLENIESAVELLTQEDRWPLIRQILARLADRQDELTPDFRAKAAWWALRSEASLDDSSWLEILESSRCGLEGEYYEKPQTPILLCYALGWRHPAAEPSEHASKIFNILSISRGSGDNYKNLRVIFRAAATIGRAWSVLHRRGKEIAASFLPLAELGHLAGALWKEEFLDYSAHIVRPHYSRMAVELVNLAFDLGDEHVSLLHKTAEPIASKYPVNHSLKSIWLLYRRRGDLGHLRLWVQVWLGKNGRLWEEGIDSRDTIAEMLLPLARELGENVLADYVDTRMRWLVITYRGHKEYGFNTPISWLTELVRVDPNSWRNYGLKIWRLSEACSAMGGDDRCSFELGEVLGAAAWSCGPADVLQLFTAHYSGCGTSSWSYPTQNRIITGLTLSLSWGRRMPSRSALSAWCFAVGLSRWFEEDAVKRLSELRHALVDSVEKREERSEFSDAIAHLTPSEFERGPSEKESKDMGETTEAVSLEAWLDKIEAGAKLKPHESLQILRHTLKFNNIGFSEIASKILPVTCSGAEYGWGWDGREDIIALAALLSDEQMWLLVGAVAKNAGMPGHWMQGIYRSLHHILLSRATRSGAAELESGLNTIIAMHERWAGLGNAELSLPLIKFRDVAKSMSWNEMAANGLTFLLNSRSAEVLESALVGVHALVKHEPAMMSVFLEEAELDPWKRKWVLNAAEAWVVRGNKEVHRLAGYLNRWIVDGSLSVRVQSWIVLSKVAKELNSSPPGFPNPPGVKSGPARKLLSPIRGIMETPELRRGADVFTNIHQAISSAIDRIERVTTADLRSVRSSLAERLRTIEGDDESGLDWSTKIVCAGDLLCSSLESDQLLDDELDARLAVAPMPSFLQGPFAQAFLSNEDPWMLMHTPRPRVEWPHWPSEDDLYVQYNKLVDRAALRRNLFLLATQDGIEETEIVIAARVKVSSHADTFIFRLWREEEDGSHLSARTCPTTLSGRTFAFDFPEWWEPYREVGKRPLCFAVGGTQRLGLSFPEFMPSKLWQTVFGWQPTQDPLIWQFEGRDVARYESTHGPLGYRSGGHRRMPIMGRWIVQKVIWDALTHKYGPFHLSDDFQRFPAGEF